MKNQGTPECAKCSVKNRICVVEGGKGPDFCPTINYGELVEKSLTEYEKLEIREFARLASIQEAECYTNRDIQPYILHPVKPRVQEICEFSKKMGYEKLGVAFCGGVHTEARTFTNILEAQGFKVASVMCKCGRIPKEVLGIQEDEKINIGQFESMCNPVVQAHILNEEKTDFNILLGICVGHDSLFFKYSQAFTTVLFAKDRVLGHNPTGALHLSGSYSPGCCVPGSKVTLNAVGWTRECVL